MATSPTPDELRARLDSCEKKIAFTELASRLQDLAASTGQFKANIARLRERGYVFAASLEQQSAALPELLSSAKLAAERAIMSQGRVLRAAIDRARMNLRQADGVTRIESDISEAETQIRGTFSAVEGSIGEIESSLDKIGWYLDQRDEASFKFLAGEALFIANQAEWVASGRGKDDPDGILFVTDQRLVFEQKETTGKTFGLFGGKKVQELEWEIPLHQISEAKSENKGLFGGKDMVYLTLKSGAKFDQITLEIKGGVDCKWWVTELNRLLTGNVQAERVGTPEAAAQAQVRNAPSKCPACNANLPMLVAGQMQIQCDHCGTVIRV